MSQSASNLSTRFAPAARAPVAFVRRQHDLIARTEMLRLAFELMPFGVAILNAQRQIVYANHALARLLADGDADSAIGLRPGEALQCVHSTECAGGCGTTEFCQACGAVKVILAAQQGHQTSEECRIVSRRLGSDLDLRTWARPFTVGTEAFTLFTLADITDQKRRESLERIFFHDVLNTAGTIAGVCAFLPRAADGERRDHVETLGRLSRELIDEVKAQRDLSDMETGELIVSLDAIRSVPFLESLADAYRRQAAAAGRTIRIDEASCDVSFTSDPTLLARIVRNMLKNALEACPAGGTVTMGCETGPDRIRFRVHNPSVMRRDVQLQVFQRFFSTKGKGRGLGTYSMKLLSERYLGGNVSFTSSETDGTTFVAEYPLVVPRESHDSN